MRIRQYSFHIRFHMFKINIDMNTDIVEYKCGTDVIRIQIWIGIFFNMEQI
jgi:hypothetical protein